MICSEFTAFLRCYATRACFKKTAVKRTEAKEVRGTHRGLDTIPPTAIEQSKGNLSRIFTDT